MLNLSEYFLEIFDLKSGKSVICNEIPTDGSDSFIGWFTYQTFIPASGSTLVELEAHTHEDRGSKTSEVWFSTLWKEKNLTNFQLCHPPSILIVLSEKVFCWKPPDSSVNQLLILGRNDVTMWSGCWGGWMPTRSWNKLFAFQSIKVFPGNPPDSSVVWQGHDITCGMDDVKFHPRV